jgi:hypothetical protein
MYSLGEIASAARRAARCYTQRAISIPPHHYFIALEPRSCRYGVETSGENRWLVLPTSFENCEAYRPPIPFVWNVKLSVEHPDDLRSAHAKMIELARYCTAQVLGGGDDGLG